MLSSFSHVQLFATLWTVGLQAPLSMGFSRQEYWSGLPCSSPRDLLDPGTEPASLTLLQWQMGFFTNSATWKAECLAALLLPSQAPTTKKKKKKKGSSETYFLQNRRKARKNYNEKEEKMMSQTLFKETKYLISKFFTAIAKIFSEVQFNEQNYCRLQCLTKHCTFCAS